MKEWALKVDLDDFGPTEPDNGISIKGGKPITVWLPAGYKERFDKIQSASGRRLSKKAREALMALIDIAETRVA